LRSGKAPEPRENAIEEALRAADPDSLTPRTALELIYALRRMLTEKER
jgi:hypothetical protein